MPYSSEEWSSDDLVTFATEGVALTVVSTFGFVGNSMSIYVLARMIYKGGEDSFSFLLLGLACFDALFLLTALLAFGLTNLSTWYLSMVFPHIMVTLFGLLHTFRTGSVYVTLFINFERFYAVVFPLKHLSGKKYLLPMALIIAFVYNLPKYFELEMRLDPATNTTAIFNTELRKNPHYVFFYVVWSKIILMELFPYSTIAVCNAFIIIKIVKSTRFRSEFQSTGTRSGRNINTEEDREMRGGLDGEHRARKNVLLNQQENGYLAFVLVFLSILFITCQSFKMAPDIYELIHCGSVKEGCEEMAEGAINVVLRFSHLLVCLNSTLNFLVYYLSGRKFRTAWREAYSCSESMTPSNEIPIIVLVQNDIEHGL